MVTNKRIKTTESLQKRFFNGSKNLVIEIEDRKSTRLNSSHEY